MKPSLAPTHQELRLALQAYESAERFAGQVLQLVPRASAEALAALAIEARTQMHLRRAPLLLIVAMAAPNGNCRHLVADTLVAVIQRPDDLAEFLRIYAQIWTLTPSDLRKHLSAQVKRGMARALAKFTVAELAQDEARLREPLLLSHAKPPDAPYRHRAKRDRRQSPRAAELSPGEQLYQRIVARPLAGLRWYM